MTLPTVCAWCHPGTDCGPEVSHGICETCLAAELAKLSEKPKPTKPVMSKKETAALREKIQRHTNAIAKHRDELRKIKEDLDGLDETLTQAVESLDVACDYISQLL